MPHSDKPVATHTPDERLDYLTHRFEEFKDWQIRVDGRLDENDRKMAALEVKMESISSGQKDNTILLQKVLLLLQGQREPGLERPGLTEDFKTMQQTCKDLAGRLDTLTEWKNRMVWTAVGWGMGAGAGAGGIIVGIVKLLSK